MFSLIKRRNNNPFD